MKKLAIILLLLFVTAVCVVTSAAEITNVPPDSEKSIRAGAIIVTQNGFPPSSVNEHSSNSLAGEWVIPILKLIVWPVLIASVIVFFRKEIRAKLKQVTTVKGGEHVAVEFSPDVREQQKASAPNPSAPGITGNNEEFEKLKAQAATSLIVKNLADEILQNLGKTNLTDPQKMELGALTVAALRIDGFFWRAYTLIFGTQITLLQELNSRNLSEQEIQTYFNGVKARFPEAYASWTHQTYLEFLKNFALIQIVGGICTITEHGREFLVWMAKNQVSPNKGL